ncbi:uncharacterized protein LOC113234066 [Hyposmocoma kahamanoa]|uniref:uncharacterized protein LOC113234066 n=1 Tax=Hyposmocoma kahamanoa TaxID=1477025 RepID=UPI000E6D7D19|nr:uncharacterized protein LOC113234066 [Hyposmocoma kahamanoa]
MALVIMTSVHRIFGLSFCFLWTTFGAQQRCLLYMERCVSHCPVGMHPYHTRCDKDTISQKTCDTPESINLGFTCGWSRCDCNNNLVLFDDGTCGPYEECVPRSARRISVVRSRERYNGAPKHSRRIHKSELIDVIDKQVDDD